MEILQILLSVTASLVSPRKSTILPSLSPWSRATKRPITEPDSVEAAAKSERQAWASILIHIKEEFCMALTKDDSSEITCCILEGFIRHCQDELNDIMPPLSAAVIYLLSTGPRLSRERLSRLIKRWIGRKMEKEDDVLKILDTAERSKIRANLVNLTLKLSLKFPELLKEAFEIDEISTAVAAE
jgi:hypothetical protein